MALKVALTAVLAVAGAIATPDTAQADRSDCPTGLERAYTKRWHQVRDMHGKRAPGRNIRRDGVIYRGTVFDAVCSELARSRRQLNQLLTAPPVMQSRAVPPPQPPAGVQTDFDEASLPSCTWMPESGGSYTAYNPTSGASGKYQIIPSTWAAHCSDLARDPAGQEQCAARVWQAQGAGAWTNC